MGLLLPKSAMIVGAFLWALVGVFASSSVVSPQNPVRTYPCQTAVLRVSLQPQQPEWGYFHAKWKFLAKNSPVLYYTVECRAGPSSEERTCQRTVEKEGLYEARADIEEDGSLVLRDVRPEDAGTYEIHILALDVAARAEVELVVMGGNGREFSFPGTQLPQGSTRAAGRKGASWDRTKCPPTAESGLPTQGGLSTSEPISLPPRAISAAINHTAWLPITLQSLGSAWAFLSIKWEFLIGNRSISVLVCLLSNCSRSALEWWEKECTVLKEVAGEYQRRVDICRNGTLVIHRVGLKDAGLYRATIRGFRINVQAAVNLTVTQGTSGSLCCENIARITMAGFLLCFLGLLVGEHVWATVSSRPTSQPGKEGREPL